MSEFVSPVPEEGISTDLSVAEFRPSVKEVVLYRDPDSDYDLSIQPQRTGSVPPVDFGEASFPLDVWSSSDRDNGFLD